MNKSDAILLFAAIMVGLDALANGFLLLYPACLSSRMTDTSGHNRRDSRAGSGSGRGGAYKAPPSSSRTCRRHTGWR